MPNGDIRKFYMKTAFELAKYSYAQKKKVGCIIVKDNRIISMGYNGTPNGFDNCCEDKLTQDANLVSCDITPSGLTSRYVGDVTLKTKQEVIHAEMNAISKVARSTESCLDADLYCTLSPCIECAKMIIQSGIKNVYYGQLYRNDDGLKLLDKAGIKCELLN